MKTARYLTTNLFDALITVQEAAASAAEYEEL
jgi:hypothetical protein